MEYLITRAEPDNVIAHHGIKGQRWGQRRYQNKDGSLTPAGQKRYNKEVEKLKKETAKVKAEQKVLATRKKTQAKFDKLEEQKKKLEEQKKALHEEKYGKKKTDDSGEATDSKAKGKSKGKDKLEETVEEKRERLLKSSDAKELFENRDLLTNAEIQDRINRINIEKQLKDKIPVEVKKTVKDYLDDSIQIYKKVDEAYKTVKDSAIGKTVANMIGMEEDAGFNIDKFMANRDKMSLAKLKEADDRLKYYKNQDDYKKNTGKEKDKEYTVQDYYDFVKNPEKYTAKEAKIMNEIGKNVQTALGNKSNIDKSLNNQQNPQNQNNGGGSKKDKQKTNEEKTKEQKTLKQPDKMTQAEIDKKVKEAADALEKAAKQSGKELDVNERQLEAMLDEYGDFFFLE